MEQRYRQLLNWLSLQGIGKGPTQTPFEYLQQAKASQSPEQVRAIADISEAYVRWRYGGEKPDLDKVNQALHLLKALRKPIFRKF
jgi:hypothetical protein